MNKHLLFKGVGFVHKVRKKARGVQVAIRIVFITKYDSAVQTENNNVTRDLFLYCTNIQPNRLLCLLALYSSVGVYFHVCSLTEVQPCLLADMFTYNSFAFIICVVLAPDSAVHVQFIYI